MQHPIPVVVPACRTICMIIDLHSIRAATMLVDSTSTAAHHTISVNTIVDGITSAVIHHAIHHHMDLYHITLHPITEIMHLWIRATRSESRSVWHRILATVLVIGSQITIYASTVANLDTLHVSVAVASHK